MPKGKADCCQQIVVFTYCRVENLWTWIKKHYIAVVKDKNVVEPQHVVVPQK